jgi:hypothetical protein
MSRRQRTFGPRLLSLVVIPVLAGVGCVTTYPKPPTFHADREVMEECRGKTPDNHDIEVDDMGGVSVSHKCVAISRSAHGYGHKVRWRSKSAGKSVSIIFFLVDRQAEPFEQMSCSKPDEHGTRLCVLTACPDRCETTFRADYQPYEKTSPNAYLNYYYYDPGVPQKSLGGGAVKAGGDPGIRIDP